MSETSGDPATTGDATFKAYFEVLQRSGEILRSNIFFFVVVYGALLVWALNAIVYPSGDQRMKRLQQADAQLIACLLASRDQQTDKLCAEILDRSVPQQAKIFAAKMKAEQAKREKAADKKLQSAETEPPKLSETDIAKMDLNYVQHEMEHQHDKATELAQFSVPFIGIASDRNWLWLVNILIGLFSLYVVKDSLNNLYALLTAMLRRFDLLNEKFDSVGGPDPRRDRLIILSTAQVLTSSWKQTEMAAITVLKKYLLLSIFYLPIVISLLILFEWGYYCGGDVAVFKTEPEFWGGLLTLPTVPLQFLILFSIGDLLAKLIDSNDKIRERLRAVGLPGD